MISNTTAPTRPPFIWTMWANHLRLQAKRLIINSPHYTGSASTAKRPNQAQMMLAGRQPSHRPCAFLQPTDVWNSVDRCSVLNKVVNSSFSHQSATCFFKIFCSQHTKETVAQFTFFLDFSFPGCVIRVKEHLCLETLVSTVFIWTSETECP